jgi:hypothetical protein
MFYDEEIYFAFCIPLILVLFFLESTEEQEMCGYFMQDSASASKQI